MICGNCGKQGVSLAHVKQCYGIKTKEVDKDLEMAFSAKRPVRVGPAMESVLSKRIPEEDRVYLNVPFDEKEKAKLFFGATWDPFKKLWYVDKSADFDEMPKHWLRERSLKPLEDGMYCLDGEYYMVYHAVHGSGMQVSKRLEISDEDREKLNAKEEIPVGETIGEWKYSGRGPLYQLSAGDMLDKTAAAIFGSVYGFCGICGTILTNETSKKRGIGPVCMNK